MRKTLHKAIEEAGVYFIAELGQNHQGDINIAKKMVDSLRGTGVAAIKSAKRDLETCLTDEQKAMVYDNPHSFGRTYLEHRQALELSKDEYRELKEYAEQSGFDFISSFTDENSLDYLIDIGVETLKIASQRLTDWPLMKRTADTGRPVVISTGMSDICDVDEAIDVFAQNDKYLLQCTSCYPCPEKELNLAVMDLYRGRYGDKVIEYGFSGHHVGIAPDLAAYVMGARIIERHYTLHRHWKGTDHAASLELPGVAYILKYIQQIREAVGHWEKRVLECELPAMKKLRG